MAGIDLHKASSFIVILSLTLQGFAPIERSVAKAAPAQPEDVNSPVVELDSYQPPEFARPQPRVGTAASSAEAPAMFI
jgi:hypothetical protein